MIKSPCIFYCVVKNEVCHGCGRSLEEIEEWMLLNDEERLKVIEVAKKRLVEIGEKLED